MIPIFFLKGRRNHDYRVFNPVDSHDYVMNYPGYRILEMCDGMHSPEEVAEILAKGSRESYPEMLETVQSFLDEAYQAALIAWKTDRVSPQNNYPPPAIVFWDITRGCNLKCVHCCHTEYEAREEDLPLEDVLRVAGELASYGVKDLIFSGGEPLTRKDFPEILRFVSGLGFDSVNVCTNGTLLTRSIARELADMKMNVQVSLDGDSPALHEQIRGVPGSFTKAVRGIRYLVAAGVQTTVCSMLLSLNSERLLQIHALAQELGVKSFRVQRLVQVGRGKSNGQDLTVPPEELRRISETLESKGIPVASFTFTLKPPLRVAVDSCGSGACSAGTTSCSITSDGNVVPCSYFWGFQGDSVRNHTFGWIWEHSPVLNCFRNILIKDIRGVCRQCQWFSQCNGGCKAENYASGDLFSSSPSCWVADDMRQKMPS